MVSGTQDFSLSKNEKEKITSVVETTHSHKRLHDPKEIGIELLLFYCSYRALISFLLFDFQPIVLVVTSLFAIYNILFKRTLTSLNRTIVIFLLLNWVYIIVNGLLFFKKETFIKGITQYILFLLIIFISCNGLQITIIKRLLKYLVFINIPNALGSIFETITKRYILPNSHYQFNDDGMIRTAAFNGDMIALPIILGICVMICIYYFSRNKKLLYLSLSFLFFIAAVASQSRGPLVAIMVSLVITFIMYNNSKNKGSLSPTVIGRILSICLLFLLFYILVVETNIFSNTPLAHFAQRIRTIFVWDNSNGDHSNASRILIWGFWIKQFTLHPLLGQGIGVTGSDLDVTKGATESAVLKRLVELGAIGTVINITMLVLIIVHSINTIKRADEKNKMLYCTIFSFLIMMCIEGLVLQIDEYYTATTVVWLFTPILFSRNKEQMGVMQ